MCCLPVCLGVACTTSHASDSVESLTVSKNAVVTVFSDAKPVIVNDDIPVVGTEHSHHPTNSSGKGKERMQQRARTQRQHAACGIAYAKSEGAANGIERIETGHAQRGGHCLIHHPPPRHATPRIAAAAAASYNMSYGYGAQQAARANNTSVHTWYCTRVKLAKAGADPSGISLASHSTGDEGRKDDSIRNECDRSASSITLYTPASQHRPAQASDGGVSVNRTAAAAVQHPYRDSEGACNGLHHHPPATATAARTYHNIQTHSDIIEKQVPVPATQKQQSAERSDTRAKRNNSVVVVHGIVLILAQ